MEKVQEELEDKVVEGTAGGGAVTATANGKERNSFHLKSVLTLLILKILKHFEDLCYGRSQRCSQKADDMMAEGMSAVTGGINIPGLF